MKETQKDQAEWIRSPITERTKRLRPDRELTIHPFNGRKKKIRLIRTEIFIGASPGCDLRMEDPFISARHAVLRLEESGGGYVVEDLSSRNGVFLNGVRVNSAPLPAVGSLRIGRSTISWTQDSVESSILTQGYVMADPKMFEVAEAVKRAAQCRVPVLFLGETGTGKDVLARALHQLGSGGSAPYVPINCSLTGGPLAESELFGHRKGAFTGAETARIGALRSADGGTLFLDEVADMPMGAQVKLLRALEGGEVKALGADRADKAEFRLISATSRDLDARIEDGSFRSDLYFRVAGIVVNVPPLRARPRDIVAISKKMAQDRGLELDDSAEERLLNYAWPGNVRELRACMERAIGLASSTGFLRIVADHLNGMERRTLRLQEPESIRRTLHEAERECLEGALERNGWARKATAIELGISRSGLWEKMRRHGFTRTVEKSY